MENGAKPIFLPCPWSFPYSFSIIQKLTNDFHWRGLDGVTIGGNVFKSL
jgi:hypothetical protein